MWWLILAFLAMVAVFTLIAYAIGRWVSSFVQSHIEGRLIALNQIVNDEQVPDSWLKPYRRRAAKLRASGASEQRLRGLEKEARKRCLMQIEELKRFSMETGVAATVDTKRLITTSLEEQAQRWRDDATWHELVDFTRERPVETSILDNKERSNGQDAG